MGVTHKIHIGGIIHANSTVKTLTNSSKNKLIYELNLWFFDFYKNKSQAVKQLPAIDDWRHSTEDNSYWEILFLNEWRVWIREDTLEF
jgi:hypothetical protein